MADEDQQNSFQSRAGEFISDVAGAAAATLGAIASGLAVKAREVLDLADEAGVIQIPIDSTCVAHLEYHTITGNLNVTLTDGSTWPYHRVSMFNLLSWLNDPSKGAFFNRYVRGQWT